MDDAGVLPKKLTQFGELIVARADGGVGVELVPKHRCEGGFAINAGRIAAFPGLKPLLPGLCGSQAIDPAYEEIKETCKLSSLGPAKKRREQAYSSEFAVSDTKQQKKG